MSHRKKGFTLIEALTVIGVLAVLIAIAVPSYASMRKNVVFGNTFQEIISTLRMAQNKSMTAQDGKMWGVEFNLNSYKIFSCNDNNCSPPSYTTETDLDGLTLSKKDPITGITTPLTTPLLIKFNRLSGNLYNTSTKQIIGVENNASIKNIEVEPNGNISPKISP